jgi:FtsH-binding integral membrane protein
MHCIGAILIVAGALAGIAGDWMILIRAYRYGGVWFFTCLVFPFVGWLFASLRMPRPAVPLTLSLGGVLLMAVGYCLLGAGT